MLGDAGLSRPEDLFDIHYFTQNTRPFFSFAKKLWPGTHPPADTHRFIREIEQHGKLLRNYTQNIDTLETVCGIDRVIQCHGSFASATCTRFSHCGTRCPGESVKDAVMAGELPFCPRCKADPPPSLVHVPACQPTEVEAPAGSAECLRSAEGGEHPTPTAERTAPRFGRPHSKVDEAFDRGVLKPDIVFFGEPLQDSFFDKINTDIVECDLLIVMGTSLAVAPVNGILDEVGADVPRILINREPVAYDDLFDLQLLGNCDAICNVLAERLRWSIAAGVPSPDRSVTDTAEAVDLETPFTCHRSGVCAHRWLFEGAVERSRRGSSQSAPDSDAPGNEREAIFGGDIGDIDAVGEETKPEFTQPESPAAATESKKRGFDELDNQ